MAKMVTVSDRYLKYSAEYTKLDSVSKPTKAQVERRIFLFNEMKEMEKKLGAAEVSRLRKQGTLAKSDAAAARREALKAQKLDPPQGNVPEPAVQTGPRGKVTTKKVTEADDLQGVGKPGRKETWKETQARLVKELKADPRKKGPTASRADPDSAQYAAAIKAKKAKEDTASIAKDVKLAKLKRDKQATERRSQLRSKEGRAKFKSPKDYQVGYRDFGSKDAPGTKVNISSADKAVTQRVANRAVNEVFEDTPGRFGTAAGKRAIKGFFSDVLGIDDITVTYDDPAKFGQDVSSSTGEDISGYGGGEGKKKGGKVTAKRPTAKKYAMNRGGKVASVRKPTRA